MYQINLKTQVLECGVKVVREEKGTIIEDFDDYREALTYLNNIYTNLSNNMMVSERDYTSSEIVIKSLTRKCNGIVIVRFIDKRGIDKKRTYTIVKKR